MRIRWLLPLVTLLISLASGAAMAQTQAQRDTRETTMWKHEYAEVNGVKLHYVIAGENNSKTILFLHGFPEFWYEWKDQLIEFGKDYRAVAPDLRGYNLSSKPPKVEDYAMSLLIEDVKGLLDKLSKGKRAILVGHDWGGAVAWAFAAAHPDYLEKLVIINAPHPGVFQRELKSNPAQQKASGYMLLFRGDQAESILSSNNYAALATAVFKSSTKAGVFTDDDQRKYIEAWSQPGALTGGLNYYRAAKVGPPAAGSTEVASETLIAQLPSLKVNVPTLVIWGEKDVALLTGNLEGLDQYVPDLRIKRVPEGTHWVIHEEPAVVNGYIRDFLSGKK